MAAAIKSSAGSPRRRSRGRRSPPYAASDALGALIGCMTQDSAADPATLNQLKQRQTTLDGTLARAKAASSHASAKT
jgi:hypothetical protein